MIVDTSALIAILRKEPEAARMLQALATADSPSLSAGTWVELGAVTSSGDDAIQAQLALLMSTFSISIAPVSAEQAKLGHAAYRAFGKGRHPAQLNLGDCFAYALAKAAGEPLLFKGKDFTHTDVVSAI